MRFSLLSIFMLLTGTAAFSTPELTSLQWTNRVLVLLASSENDTELKKQQFIALQAAAGFSERDLIVLAETRTNGPLHRRFGLADLEFRVFLLGKDGHIALERSQPVSAQELYSIIDAMPMRREEIRGRKGSGQSD